MLLPRFLFDWAPDSVCVGLLIPCCAIPQQAQFLPAPGRAFCAPACVPSLRVRRVSDDAKCPPRSTESSPPEASVLLHIRPARRGRREPPWPISPYPPQPRLSSIWPDGPPAGKDDSGRNKAAVRSRLR